MEDIKQKYKVAGIGELLWDVLPSGKQAGGAPFNFAFYASQAGCESYIFSAVGKDQLGEEILLKVNQLGLDGQYIQENSYPTSTVNVRLDEEGHPGYTIHQQVAWDYMHWNEDMKEFASKLDAICFGSLAQRSPVSAQTIRSFLAALNPKCLKVFDINLRQNYFSKVLIMESMRLSNMLKMNEEELPIVADYFGLQGRPRVQLRQLIQRFNFKYVAYTMGSKGSILISTEECSVMKAPNVKVVDTVGAGDSFTASMVAGILQKIPLREAHKKATEVAAFVCTNKGAIMEMRGNK